MKPLLDQLCSFFDIQGVLDHLPRDSRHVGRFPSKDVLVCPEEGDERAFLFVIEFCPDQSHLGWIGRVEHDLLEFLIEADPGLGCLLGWNFSFVLKGVRGKLDVVPLDFGL